MIPEFGKREPGVDYVDRPGAYGFIHDAKGFLAVVRLGLDRHYLPGGGMEAGETPTQSMLREIAEELAHDASVGPLLGRATQYLASSRGGHFAVRAHYFAVTLGARLDHEPEHELLWLPVDTARAVLVREADRWALDRLQPPYEHKRP